MHHRLGSFRPRPGSRDFEHLLTHEELGVEMARALEEMFEIRLHHRAVAEMPDLLDALEPAHPDRPWVVEIHDRLSRMEKGGRPFQLLACEYVPGRTGFLALAAGTLVPAFEVIPGDRFQIGFAAMRGGEGGVRLWPRLLREVCANGSLVALGEFQSHEGAVGIGEAIDRCFTPAVYEPALRALQEARRTSVPDARGYLDEFGRVFGGLELMRRHYERVQREVDRAGDHSLYGLMNAVTATARDVDDWGERLELEEFAGALARLRRPVPSRSAGRALTPA